MKSVETKIVTGCSSFRALTIVSLAIVLLFLPTAGTAQLEQAIQMELKRNPAALFKTISVGYTHKDVNQLLEQIYQPRAYQPLWHQGNRFSDRGEVAMSFLESAATEGLHLSDYHVDTLQRLRQQSDIQSQAKLDIVLSMAVGRYAADLRTGRLGVRRVDPKLFASARDGKVDVVEVVTGALNAPDVRAYFRSLAPPNHQYQSLKKLLARYREIERAGGWQPVADGKVIKSGMKDSRLPDIRRNLKARGDWQGAVSDSPEYDSATEQAVKRFQLRHGLEDDGVIGKGTLREMNVPVSARVKQIALNMERWRWNSRDLGGRHIIVNIASFYAGGIRDEQVEFGTRAVVGKLHHETPVFSDKIEYLEFNPYWNVPVSIAKNEYLPKLRKDPAAVKAKGIRIFSRWGEESSEIDILNHNWQATSTSEIAKYHIRQEPGPHNALGRVKLMFPNEHNVYLHDTPSHSLFNRETRAFSHGCIRLDEPLKMAAYVLGQEDPSWTLDRVKEVVASKERTIVKLKQALPVHITYRTVVVRNDGNPYFYRDIYKRDVALAKAVYRAG